MNHTVLFRMAGWRQLLLLICLLLSFAPLNAAPITLSDGLGEVFLNPQMDILADPSHALSIEQVTSSTYQPQFQPNSAAQQHFGRADVAWWFRVSVTDRGSDSHWYLLVDFPNITTAKAFVVATDGRIQPLGEMRKPTTNIPTVYLPTPHGQTQTIYLRVSSMGKDRLFAPIKVLSAEALQAKTNVEHFYYGAIGGALLILAAYSLFLFFSIREHNYLTLTIMLCLGCLVSQRSSNTLPFLSFLSDPSHTFYSLSFQLLVVVHTHAWLDMIGSKTHFPRVDRWLRLPLLVALVTIPFTSLLPGADLWSYLWASFFVIEFVLISIFTYRTVWRSPLVQYIGLLQLVVILFYVPTLLWGLGVVQPEDVNATIRLAQIGFLLAGIFLSLMHTEHTRLLRFNAMQAEASNQAKSEFLATMSHELRTPMNAVISAGTLLNMTALSEQQQNYVSKQEAASRHMLGLINNVLDLERIDNSQLPLENVPFRLQDIIQQVERLLGEQARAKQLPLDLDNQVAPPYDYLLGDPTRLTQILVNVVGNAIKFTHQGRVSLQITPAWVADHRACLTFKIKDTGIGIALEQQAAIFQPFTQASRSTARQYGGSGLGLAISRKLVANMGGSLKLTSQFGKGSVFSFTLTFTVHTATDTATENAPSTPITQAMPLVGTRILLVDDDSLNRFFGQELLQTLGVSVMTASSGQDALQLLQQQHIDLVLMDVSMPDMDGYETTRRLRALPRFAELPIVALTAHTIPGERERCLAAGMNDYLPKPFGLEQLQGVICQALGAVERTSNGAT
ncbi:response regulator [Thiothrix subterranea]|uniref:hybrid sensor histidine kinase/response regulator n=1 Tax=Thiothrix subterranea TaxID=2735563 RepID=UPI00192A995A|nr:hybrid sensor histidine kinase/response regulator [Thiothrix subterranea]QQZ28406.1 response regulator [Thiothrix subterranea]